MPSAGEGSGMPGSLAGAGLLSGAQVEASEDTPVVTEEFYDPDYLFASETVRLVEAAGFTLEERFGSFLVYTVNFRKVSVT